MTTTARLGWQESYASPTLGNYDNDGLLDLHVTTVYPGGTSVLYRNLHIPRLGDWAVLKVGAKAAATPSDPPDEEVIRAGFFDERWLLP